MMQIRTDLDDSLSLIMTRSDDSWLVSDLPLRPMHSTSDCCALRFVSESSSCFSRVIWRRRVQWNHEWSSSDEIIWTTITTDEVVVEYVIGNSPEDDYIHLLHSKEVLLFQDKTSFTDHILSYWSMLLLLTTREPKLRVDMSDPLASDPNPSDRSIYLKCSVFPKESMGPGTQGASRFWALLWLHWGHTECLWDFSSTRYLPTPPHISRRSTCVRRKIGRKLNDLNDLDKTLGMFMSWQQQCILVRTTWRIYIPSRIRHDELWGNCWTCPRSKERFKECQKLIDTRILG